MLPWRSWVTRITLVDGMIYRLRSLCRKSCRRELQWPKENKVQENRHQHYFISFKGIIANNKDSFHVTELTASGKAVGTSGKLAVPPSVLLRWEHKSPFTTWRADSVLHSIFPTVFWLGNNSHPLFSIPSRSGLWDLKFRSFGFFNWRMIFSNKYLAS